MRVRGCFLASWDYLTHQVTGGESKIYGADITVDQPAPVDLFATPGKTIPELLLFDPQASLFQRVKVSGQIVYVRDAEYFLTDGTHGLRFIAKTGGRGGGRLGGGRWFSRIERGIAGVTGSGGQKNRAREIASGERPRGRQFAARG